ncbi:LamG-like jellyroll fold domain-containing protein [Amycolatopsis cihanbeyliensis]
MRRFLPAVAALSLPLSLIAVGQAGAERADPESPEVTAALSAAEEAGEPVAVESETTEYSEVEANPDGTLTLRQSHEPQRVRRNDQWVPVDLTLQRRADGTIGPKASPVQIRFATGSRTGTAELAVVAKDGREVGIGWNGDLPEPRLSGPTATYPEVLPGIDLVLTAKNSGFSQVLAVKNAQAARNPELRKLSFPSHERGVAPRLARDGGIEVLAEDGSVAFRGDASRMWDSRGNGGQTRARALASAAGSESAKSTMDVQVEGDAVVVHPDQEFLTSPERVFPVFIDPEYWWSGSKQNHAVVQSRWPDQRNYNRTDGDLGDLKAGVQGGYISRSFFDIGVGPMRGKVIHRATVRSRVIHSWSCDGGPTDLWLTGGIGPGTTWNSQPGWHRKLGSIYRSNHAAYCPSDGHAEVPIDGLMREAAGNGWTTMTFGLRATTMDSNDWRRFALDPVLEVVYNSAPDQPGELSMEGGEIPCATGQDRPFVFTETPRLRGRLSDPDAGMLDARFSLRSGPVGDSSEIWSGSTGNVPSGSFAEVTVPAGKVTEEGTYNWSMHVTDGDSSSNWVGNCEFEVDKTAPGTPAVSSTDYPGGGDTVAGGIGQTGAFTVTANGTSDVDHFLWSVTEDENDDPRTRADADRLGGSALVRWTPTLAGPQTMFVRSVDRAGNRSEIVRYKIFVREGEPLTTKLSGHWKLDGDTADGSGNDRTLTATGEADLTAEGYTGEAVSLDGSDQHLSHAAPVLDTSRSYSVSAWAKLDRAGEWWAVASQDGQHSSGFQLQATPDGKWAVVMFSEDVDGGGSRHARIVSEQGVQPGAWTHLVAAYDHGAEELRLYVNGAPAGELDYASTWNATGDFHVGAAMWKGARTDFFPGDIDEVRAYQRVIVDSEAALLANQPVLRAHYPLDEGSGDVAEDVATGRTAELTGTAGWSTGGEHPAAEFAGQWGENYGAVRGPRPAMRTDRSYTVSAWVRLDEVDDYARTAVSFGGDEFSPFMLQYRPESQKWCLLTSLRPDGAGGWFVLSEQQATAGEWVLLTGVYDVAHQETRLYVDGRYTATRTGVTGWNGPGELMIGGSRWTARDTDPWNGTVRDVRLYSGVLSDREIGRLYAQN